MVTARHATAVTLLAGLFIAITLHGVMANPTGASIIFNETAGSPSSSPSSRADPRATITTINLNAVQQDQHWKAYVGNVSGRLSLDNADGFTIYDWELIGSVGGEVYVARNQSVDFTNVTCANSSNIAAENSFFSISQGARDSINSTYNESSHSQIVIGGNVNSPLAADSCPSTATYVNDSAQSMDGTQAFQAAILQDPDNNIIFTTLISDDEFGYDTSGSQNRTYDFQIIIPEADTGSATTYYFWTELDG